jgi:hypothetical protein
MRALEKRNCSIIAALANANLFRCGRSLAVLVEGHHYLAIQNDIKALANSAGLRVDDKKLTVFRAIDSDDGKRPDLLIPTMEIAGTGVGRRLQTILPH